VRPDYLARLQPLRTGSGCPQPLLIGSPTPAGMMKAYADTVFFGALLPRTPTRGGGRMRSNHCPSVVWLQPTECAMPPAAIFRGGHTGATDASLNAMLPTCPEGVLAAAFRRWPR